MCSLMMMMVERQGAKAEPVHSYTLHLDVELRLSTDPDVETPPISGSLPHPVQKVLESGRRTRSRA